MRQVDLLRMIANKGGQVFITLGWHGQYHLVIDHETIPAQVWQRLLDRDDLDIFDSHTPTGKELRITEQGKARLETSD